MKKILTISIVSAFVLTLCLSACKKDYTCECTVKDSSGAVISTMSTSVTLHTTKKKAKDACTVSAVGSGYTETCEVK